ANIISNTNIASNTNNITLKTNDIIPETNNDTLSNSRLVLA
ncbi:33809_t:CDS:1, partial [Racocetra persica]